MANRIVFVTFLTFVCTVDFYSCKPADMEKPVIISREEWEAEPATSISPLDTPVPFVVIHHSSVPAACYDKETCKRAMRSMQLYHQKDNNWADIGYNFAVGSDGLVYEGRGWDRLGAHAAPYNSRSIGIVLIGHWVSELPPPAQLKSTQKLIALGVRLGYIQPQYALIGHRQVRETECPGEALYAHISRWPHFEPAVQYTEENLA